MRFQREPLKLVLRDGASFLWRLVLGKALALLTFAVGEVAKRLLVLSFFLVPGLVRLSQSLVSLLFIDGQIFPQRTDLCSGLYVSHRWVRLFHFWSFLDRVENEVTGWLFGIL